MNTYLTSSGAENYLESCQVTLQTRETEIQRYAERLDAEL